MQREPAHGTCLWLRFFDRSGNLVPLAAERAQQERQRAEQAEARAALLAAQLRQLGIDPD